MPSFEKGAHFLGLFFYKTSGYAQAVTNYLNQLEGVEGFIFQNYSAGGTKDKAILRLYYSDENAKKIDAIREVVKEWHQLKLIDDDEFYILLYALLDEASHHSNTTATMNSFLKKLTRKAQHIIYLKLPTILYSTDNHQVYCKDSLTLTDTLDKVDILYLDPPYTRLQYSASYHILETIARWDSPRNTGCDRST